MKHIFILIFCLITTVGCAQKMQRLPKLQEVPSIPEIEVGAAHIEEFAPLLKGKRVAMLGNHTSMVGNTHTLDMLISNGINMVAVFSPEHGFRGTASAGEHVASSIDEKTGVPILSLYSGKSPRPSDEDMQKFDVLIVDIQDVGLRFYTYYITMVRLMDACADFGKLMIVLDRPNPNGYYVDGPILDMQHKSGVGYLPIPVVHGMTLGELAQMVNGEGWLPDGKQCPLRVITCRNYTHQRAYQLPIAPSPNLRNQLAIYLYPSICLFEGTPVSLGRGTDLPFLCYGHPDFRTGNEQTDQSMIQFTPRDCSAAKNPTQKDQLCYGFDLSHMTEEEAMKHHFDLSYVIDAYNRLHIGEAFFTKFFVKLTGQSYIQEMIIAGKSAEEIRAMWKEDVNSFLTQRKPYLLYEE